MAERELSILVRAKGAAQAAAAIGGVDKAVGNLGRRTGEAVRTTGRNVALLGGVAAGGIALAVRSGLEDLAELESAITSVDGAIKTLGLTGQLSGAQIAGWADDIERDIGAAFDDKAITAAAATLLRFGKVAPKNLKPALVVMTDLAVKTGDIDSAASLLAKSLADPAKAAGKLARQGIILTEVEKKQVAAMVAVGDAAGAQALLLDIVAKSTEGAARASQGPYQRALSTLSDVTEDARKALAEGFLPVIEKVAALLSKELANPATMANIREFGKGLAAGLDDLIAIARNLPWAAIGDALKVAGAGARAVLSAFTSLPPWVQTAVITGWGLNKLTGGFLGDIVGELGKGLIKGVLGMNAGVVNINAAVVNGGGGPGIPGGAKGGGAPSTLTGGGGIVGLFKTVGQVAAVAAVPLIAAEVAMAIKPVTAATVEAGRASTAAARRLDPANIRRGLETPLGGIQGATTTADAMARAAAARTQTIIQAGDGRSEARLIALHGGVTSGALTIAGQVRQSAGDTRSELVRTTAAASQAAAASRATTQAVKDKDLSVTVPISLAVTTRVSVSAMARNEAIVTRLGGQISSVR